MKTNLKSMLKNVVTALTIGLVYTSTAYAQASNYFISPEDCPQGTTCTGTFRSVLIGYVNYFLSFLGLLAVFMVIYAGILMVSSAGDEEQAKKGKTIIMWAGIGIILVLLAFTLVNFVIGVQSTTG
jgi:hypothetical protein